ncbi:MAG: hypothetical protein ACYC65_00805 [Candidatus Limnocylindrales bacterium]
MPATPVGAGKPAGAAATTGATGAEATLRPTARAGGLTLTEPEPASVVGGQSPFVGLAGAMVIARPAGT